MHTGYCEPIIIAHATSIAMHACIIMISTLGNEVPKFNGPEIFNVTVGTENIYIFSVQDNDDNFTVTIEGEVPDIGQLVDNGEGMYTFRWMLSSIPTSNVTFRAEDSLSAIVFLSPQLHVCSCFNGGTCTLDGVVSSDSLIIIMTCLCTEGTLVFHLLTS